MASVQLDKTGELWKRNMRVMLAQNCYIIALRGAGSHNGISIADANSVLERHLFPRIEAALMDKWVTVIFEGDNDDVAYPDIGYIAGRLRDHFDGRMTFYAVQMLGRYKHRDKLPIMLPLVSASGRGYDTVLFPDDTFPGDHIAFTQHRLIAQSPMYEQWYVGACGKIAHTQLADYNAKGAGHAGNHDALIFPLPVSVEQEQKIRRKLAGELDHVQRERLTASLTQRAENPFGLLCTSTGEFIQRSEYQNLNIQIIR